MSKTQPQESLRERILTTLAENRLADGVDEEMAATDLVALAEEYARERCIEELEKAKLFHFLPIYSNPKKLSGQEALLLGCKVQEQHIDRAITRLQQPIDQSQEGSLYDTL